jgi:hypothetical protein
MQLWANKEREIAGLQLTALSGQPTLSALLGAAPRIDLEWKIVEHELDEESLCRLRNFRKVGDIQTRQHLKPCNNSYIISIDNYNLSRIRNEWLVLVLHTGGWTSMNHDFIENLFLGSLGLQMSFKTPKGCRHFLSD